MDTNPLPPPQSPSQRPMHQVVDDRPGSSKGVTVMEDSASPRQTDVSAAAHTQPKKRKASTLTVSSGAEVNGTWETPSSGAPTSAPLSSSTWPSPQRMPLDQPWPQPAPSRILPSLSSTPITEGQHTFTFHGRKLCTRKPLDRPLQIRRSRANSLPTMRAVPTAGQDSRTHKKAKLSHQSPPLMLPSDPRVHALPQRAQSSLLPTTVDEYSEKEVSRASGSHKSRKPLAHLKPFTLGSWVPMRQPPITLVSLATLEAAEILRSPQLRHDLLFDNLAFRPLAREGSCSASGASPSRAEQPSRSRLASKLYWRAVATEIETGCRCVRWDKQANVPLSEEAMVERSPLPCVCGGWLRSATSKEWTRSLHEWPSRIPVLIKSLREIVLSLMASTTPCTNHYPHPPDSAKHYHSSNCPPLTTHALVPGLYAALDPDFIFSQARYGNFDLTLFDKLGAAMKVHCAPVRDRMVDDMVRLVKEEGKITEGLQRCFDCVEVMKLDIANHQLQSMRPWLTSTALEYEYAQFESVLAKAGKALATSKTIDWIKAAVGNEISQQVDVEEQARLRAVVSSKDVRSTERVHLIIRGYVSALMDLVVSEGLVGADARVKFGMAWSSTSLRDGTIRYAHPQRSDATREVGAAVPESLRLDAMRLAGFHTDIVDITILNLLLLGYRQICRARGLPCTNEDLAQMRTDLNDFLPNPSAHFYLGRQRHDEAWHSRTSSLTILMAIRAIARSSRIQGDGHADIAPQVRDMSRTLDQWLAINLVPDSTLFAIVRSRVRDVLQMSLSVQLAQPIAKQTCVARDDDEEMEDDEDDESVMDVDDAVPVGPVYSLASATSIRHAQEAVANTLEALHEQAMTRFGLEPLRNEVNALSKRIVRIASFNLQVFGMVYEQAFTS